MSVFPIQANFTRGVLDPKLHARVDIEFYKAALKSATNWTILRAGGLRKRSGFVFKSEVKNHSKRVRLIPFIFSSSQAYALEFGENYVRKFASSGGIVTKAGGTPTAITKANPGVVTLTGHGITDGSKAFITDLGGMVELNNREVTVTVINANSFSIGVNTSSYSTFTSGGTIKEIVETTTTYTETEVADLDYVGSADVLTLVHADHAPAELTRNTATSWSLADIEFKDGPYLDLPTDNTNGCQPDHRNDIHQTGSASSPDTPFGTGTPADAFDGDMATPINVNLDTFSIEWDPTGSAVCDHYWLQTGGGRSASAQPTSWTFEGYDGSDWVVLHRVSGNVGTTGEARYFDFYNNRAFQKYRMVFSCNAGRESTSPGGVLIYAISEMAWGYNGDFAPTMTLSFDNTDNINGGDGFTNADIGRHIRLFATDGRWRWYVIDAVNSTTEVEGRMYGHALPDLSKIYQWRLGAWHSGNWPQHVAFYQSRRAMANTEAEPTRSWFSKAFDFYDFGVSQPLVDDDALTLRINAAQVNEITWLAEMRDMAIGTTGAVRVLGKANQNAGFGATNFDLQPNAFERANTVRPVQVGSAALFASYYGKSLHELVYDLAQEGYTAPDVSLLSEHLLKSGIVEMAYQAKPDSVIWIVCDDGSLVALTYDREQKIVGFVPQEIGEGDTGTGAYVESVCCIPGSAEDQVWIAVRRTVRGSTYRTIECKAAAFDGDDPEDGVFLDSALVRTGGSLIDTISGLWHLRSMTVDVLADGIVYKSLSVSSTGSVTLPDSQTARVWCVGLPFSATGNTLALSEHGQQDGAGLGRRKILTDVKASVFETLSLKVKGLTSEYVADILRRGDEDPFDGPPDLRTGIYEVPFDNSWRDDGEFIFYSDDPLPCTIRAFEFNVTGEP